MLSGSQAQRGGFFIVCTIGGAKAHTNTGDRQFRLHRSKQSQKSFRRCKADELPLPEARLSLDISEPDAPAATRVIER
jgi:hypothetical protein